MNSLLIIKYFGFEYTLRKTKVIKHHYSTVFVTTSAPRCVDFNYETVSTKELVSFELQRLLYTYKKKKLAKRHSAIIAKASKTIQYA